MRTCYLHIGAPKAGSKAIQGFLGVHRDQLAEQGVEVCDFGHDDVITGPLALTGALSEESDPARPRSEPWTWLSRRLERTTGDICISREQFCNHLRDPKQLDFVLDFFRLRDVRPKLIAFIRDRVGYLNAAYTQQAKKFFVTEDFEAWCDWICTNRPARYSYWRMFRHILDKPDLDFSIRPLREVGGAALIPHFCSQIGRPAIDASGFDPTPFRNSTPDAKSVAASVFVGRVIAERGIDLSINPHLARVFKDGVAARGWTGRPFFGPDDRTAGHLDTAYAESDERFAQRLWGEHWQDRMPRVDRERNVFDIERASAQDRAEFGDLAREVVARAVKQPIWKRIGADR